MLSVNQKSEACELQLDPEEMPQIFHFFNYFWPSTEMA